MTPVAIFVRVSSKRQDYQRQVSELMEIANQRNYEVVKIFKEIISASKRRRSERPQLLQLMDLASGGGCKKILISEVSRLGRKAWETLYLIEQLNEMNVSVYSKSLGMETLTESGQPAPGAAYAFGFQAIQANEEVIYLSSRIKSGLAEAKRRNPQLKIGRPKGSFKSDEQLIKENPSAVGYFTQGKSIRQTASLADISPQKAYKIHLALKKSTVTN